MTILTEIVPTQQVQAYGLQGREILAWRSRGHAADRRIISRLNDDFFGAAIMADTRDVRNALKEMRTLTDPLTQTFAALTLSYDVGAGDAVKKISESFAENLRRKAKLEDGSSFEHLAADLRETLIAAEPVLDLHENLYIVVFHRPLSDGWHKDSKKSTLRDVYDAPQKHASSLMTIVRRLEKQSTFSATHENMAYDESRDPALYEPEEAFYVKGQTMSAFAGDQVHKSPNIYGYGYMIEGLRKIRPSLHPEI